MKIVLGRSTSSYPPLMEDVFQELRSLVQEFRRRRPIRTHRTHARRMQSYRKSQQKVSTLPRDVRPLNHHNCFVDLLLILCKPKFLARLQNVNKIRENNRQNP
jgi:hypothetical protein